MERKHKVIKYFSSFLPDTRNPLLITHSTEKLLKQRVFMLMQGYEDANDVSHLTRIIHQKIGIMCVKRYL